MKTLAVSMILALGLAAPAFAEPPAPQPASTQAAADPSTAADINALIDETAILEASTPEAHAKLILKCAGPPPRPPKIAEVRPAPQSASTTSSGG